MTDWAQLAFWAEFFVGIVSIPFYYLIWASGYVDALITMARDNGWGFKKHKEFKLE